MNVMQYAMIIAFGCGTLLICLSPGTLARRSVNSNPGLLTNLISFAIVSTAIYALIFVLSHSIWKNSQNLKVLYQRNSFYFDALFGGIFFAFFVGIHSNRQLFGTELMAVILCIRILPKQSFNKLILTLMGALIIGLYSIETVSLIQLHRQWGEIQRQYAQSTDGKVYINLNYYPLPFHIPRSDLFYLPITPTDKSNASNQWMSDAIVKYLHHKYPGKSDAEIINQH